MLSFLIRIHVMSWLTGIISLMPLCAEKSRSDGMELELNRKQSPIAPKLKMKALKASFLSVVNIKIPLSTNCR